MNAPNESLALPRVPAALANPGCAWRVLVFLGNDLALARQDLRAFARLRSEFAKVGADVVAVTPFGEMGQRLMTRGLRADQRLPMVEDLFGLWSRHAGLVAGERAAVLLSPEGIVAARLDTAAGAAAVRDALAVCVP